MSEPTILVPLAKFRELEWSGNTTASGYPACPSCEAIEGHAHAPNCWLGVALSHGADDAPLSHRQIWEEKQAAERERDLWRRRYEVLLVAVAEISCQDGPQCSDVELCGYYCCCRRDRASLALHDVGRIHV